LALHCVLCHPGGVPRAGIRSSSKSRVVAVCRGVEVYGRDLLPLQRRIDERPWLTRQRIAEEVCRYFGWRQGNGQWALSSCRLFLLRLQRRGLLRLPEARRGGNYRARRAKRDYPVRVLCEEGELSGELEVRPITAAERGQWQQEMAGRHYLGDTDLIGESLRYVARVGSRVVAFVGWAAAALRNGPRDRYLGWERVTRERRLRYVVNNVRFLVLPCAEGKKLASRILAANLRRLSRDWQAAYGHPLLLAESFVDGRRFRGTCYRASNWIEVGSSRGFSRRGATYEANGRPKMVFVYELHRHARRLLSAAESPVDAVGGQEVKMIDVERLPLQGNGGLFEVLEEIKDPRHRRGLRHPMKSVLAIAICAVLAGARSLAAIAQWSGELSREELRQFGSRRRRAPSEPTIRRVLKKIEVRAFDQKLGAWVARHFLGEGSAIAIDGKTLRGSTDGAQKAVHLVGAVLQEAGAVIAQHRVPDKTNEITSVRPLFDNLDIRGTVVSGDAIFAQKEIASHLVEEKHAEYFFTIKDNQPTLREELERLPVEAFSPCPSQPR